MGKLTASQRQAIKRRLRANQIKAAKKAQEENLEDIPTEDEELPVDETAARNARSADTKTSQGEEFIDELEELEEDGVEASKKAKRHARRVKRMASKIAQSEDFEEDIEKIVEPEPEGEADDVIEEVAQEAADVVVNADIPVDISDEELAEVVEDAVEDALEVVARRHKASRRASRKAKRASKVAEEAPVSDDLEKDAPDEAAKPQEDTATEVAVSDDLVEESITPSETEMDNGEGVKAPASVEATVRDKFTAALELISLQRAHGVIASETRGDTALADSYARSHSVEAMKLASDNLRKVGSAKAVVGGGPTRHAAAKVARTAKTATATEDFAALA